MKNLNSLATALCAFLFVFLLANVEAQAQRTKGNGNLKTESRQVGTFTGIKVSGGFDVELKQGNQQSLKLEVEENLMDQVKTEVKNGVLHIYTTGSINAQKGMRAFVTVKQLDQLAISGGVNVKGLSTFKTSEFKMDLSGGSNVTLALDVNKLDADMSGASKVSLTGRANDVKMDMSGASNVDAQKLTAKNVYIDASGASKIKVTANDKLDINASGASHILYAGKPSITTNTSAASRISKL